MNVYDVAEAAGVYPHEVRDWCSSGFLTGYTPDRSGRAVVYQKRNVIEASILSRAKVMGLNLKSVAPLLKYLSDDPKPGAVFVVVLHEDRLLGGEMHWDHVDVSLGSATIAFPLDI